MATTTNYNWQTPDDTDLVKDGAAAIRDLGDDIDTTVKAVSDASIAKAIVDAKGDLIAGTAADTVARVAVGTDGQVLVASSSSAAGLAWATPAGSAPVQLSPAVSGLYLRVSTSFDSAGNSDLSGATAGNTDETHYTPIYLPNCTLDRIAVRSGTYSSTGNVRLGLYNNGADNRPSSLLLDAGTVAVDAATTNFEVTISQVVTAGWYWIAVNGQSGSYQLLRARVTPNNSFPNIATAPAVATVNTNGYIETGIGGAFPANTGTLSRTATPFIGWVRIA